MLVIFFFKTFFTLSGWTFLTTNTHIIYCMEYTTYLSTSQFSYVSVWMGNRFFCLIFCDLYSYGNFRLKTYCFCTCIVISTNGQHNFCVIILFEEYVRYAKRLSSKRVYFYRPSRIWQDFWMYLNGISRPPPPPLTTKTSGFIKKIKKH